jgi:hypothetical protein
MQEVFVNVQSKLYAIADDLEKIDVNGWEICVSYSLQTIVLELREKLGAIADYKGQFAPIFEEAITMVIDPYLLAI